MQDESGSDSDFDEDQQGSRIGRKRGRGGAGRIDKKRSRQDEEVPVTLFEVVRQGKMAMTAIVDDWIEAYKADRNEALLDLIQFFINASGCKGTVTPEMLRDASEGFQDVIKRMTEEFDEDSGDYPLIASGISFKKFRSNFSDFVQALVRQCQYQIIYDQFMMDNVLTLLTELSNSQVRAFRHTSTLAAMKLMTALVNVALQLSVSLDNTQRQYEAERNKNLNKRASEKLDMLLQKRKELEDQQTEIESMLNGIFKGIFVHRYRDFIADIRALCMEEIGIWMKMFPKVFLTDSYLKYVGWTLHDKQKEVRMKCLQTLHGLYKDDEMTKDLKLFTSRFKDRIVSMTLDKEYDVAVLAIKLLILILEHCGYDSPVLSTNDAESVYQLVFSVHRPVALAAAEFLNKQLFESKEVVPGYTKRGRRRSANAPLITDLVLFFIESQVHEHATYLVDSLWEVASSMLKDWDCMTDLLLEEPANDRDQLDSRQESALVDIMVCAVKQAAEGTPPTGRQGYSKKLAVRDRRAVLEDRVRLTEHFIVALPSLLNKYQVDKEKVTLLLQIPRFFDLELYTTSRLEKHLENLLRQMAVVVEKHTDSDLLDQASMTYNVLCDNDYTMCGKAQVERQTVIDSWVESFNLALDIFKEAGNEADDEEIYNVVQALKRLTRLYMHNDLTSCEMYANAFGIVQMHQEKTDIVPEEMLAQAVLFLNCDLMYNLALIRSQEESGQTVAQDQKQAVTTLRQHATEFLRACEDLLGQSPHPKVKEASYMAICDLTVVFSPQLAHSCPALRPLVQRPSESVQHLLVEFVNTYVFVVRDDNDDDEEDTAEINALHHRRSLLAGICKLFVFNMIELRLAASIFQQYIRFYPDYGDIIKETISRSRHVNKMECAHTLALSLMTLYRETVRLQGGSLDHSSAEYGHMKELARRFSLTFGLDQVKTRDAVAILHKEGILFALKRGESNQNEIHPPENLSYLSILVEFSSKLMKQDRKTVVNYLDKHIKSHMLKNQSAGWIPLVTYRNSLIQGADEVDTGKQPVKGRRRRKRPAEMDSDAPPTPMTPAVSPPPPMTPVNQPPPQYASTAVREQVPQKQMRVDDVSGISYQHKDSGLQSWLSSEGRQEEEGRRTRSRSRSAGSSDVFEKRKPRSALASIFDSESQSSEVSREEEAKVGDVSKKMKNMRVKRSGSKVGKGVGLGESQEEEEKLGDVRKRIKKLNVEESGSESVGTISGVSQEEEERLSDVSKRIKTLKVMESGSKSVGVSQGEKNVDVARRVAEDRGESGSKGEREPVKRVSARGRLRSVPSYAEVDDDYDFAVSPPPPVKKQKTIKKLERPPQDVTIDDIDLEEDILTFSDEDEPDGRKEIKPNVKTRSPAKKDRKSTKKSRNQKSKSETQPKVCLALKELIAEGAVKTMPSAEVTSPDGSSSAGSQVSYREKSDFEGTEKSLAATSKKSEMEHPPAPEKMGEDFLSANEEEGTSSQDEDFEDAPSQSLLDGKMEVGVASDFTSESNPFARLTRAARESPKPTRKERVLSDTTEESSCCEGSDVEPSLRPTSSQRSNARSHISDVDIMDLIFDDGDIEKQENLFGAFAGVVRDVHSQSSQNIDSCFSSGTPRFRSPPAAIASNPGIDIDSLLSEDDDTSEASWCGSRENPFADVLNKVATPGRSRHLTSPITSEDDDENFARMFGFGTQKKEMKRRQPNLIGASMGMASPHQSMTSPMHQATPDYRQMQHTGYQIPSSSLQAGMHQQMQPSPQQQQQFVVPGQPMMYQQQQSFHMQSPGHLQQGGMPGQSPYYGN